MDDSLEQQENAPSPSFLSPTGSVTDCRDAHQAKAFSSIDSTVSGIVTDVSLSQL